MGKKQKRKYHDYYRPEHVQYEPDTERLAILRERIKPFARLRINASYLYLLILLVFDIMIFSIYGGTKSLTAMLYFLIGTIFIWMGSFQRIGAAGTIVKAAGDEADTLIMSGPYAKSRHPLYFGSFMNGIGFAFLAGPLGDMVPAIQENALGLIPWGLIIFAAMLVPLYIKMIRIEDEFLSEKFGPIFDKYCQAVPSFFPRHTFFTRDKDWRLDPRKLKANREMKNFIGIMIVYVLFFLKMLYYMIAQLVQ